MVEPDTNWIQISIRNSFRSLAIHNSELKCVHWKWDSLCLLCSSVTFNVQQYLTSCTPATNSMFNAYIHFIFPKRKKSNNNNKENPNQIHTIQNKIISIYWLDQIFRRCAIWMKKNQTKLFIIIINYVWFTNANAKDECNTIPLQIYKFYVNKNNKNHSTKLLSRFSFSLSFSLFFFFFLFGTGLFFFFFFIVFKSSTIYHSWAHFFRRFICSCKIALLKLTENKMWIQHIFFLPSSKRLSAYHWIWSMFPSIGQCKELKISKLYGMPTKKKERKLQLIVCLSALRIVLCERMQLLSFG